ncbi:MAG: chemotaxis protein CheW [Brevundimonas sp.]|jgi:purine-binding chemotaxis protein CheW|uniref:chemotaxis protein CheW n=1 Tax=Brevundimonas sp. TaxID=1871086 RepID=UPI0017FC7B7E|nr:chemotaxis protein CheW [Brevundimonas sp.]MBA4803344.1 chemotaxis protein CheW [Brevundimonas sp.]
MSPAEDRRELIAFRIGEQEFCVDIRAVREIRGWTPATPLPHSPAYVRGVINLRGAVLPIIDLSSRLALGTAEPSARHVIIVARVGLRTVGLLVEAVSDILTISDEMIQATPDIACEVVRSFVKGVIPVDGRMISLIALDGLLPETPTEMAA